MSTTITRANRENYPDLKVGIDYDEVLKIFNETDYYKSILHMKNCILKKSKSKKIKNFADKLFFI
jgi:hypothetical protein